MPDNFQINRFSEVDDDGNEVKFLKFQILKDGKHFAFAPTLRDARSEIEAYLWIAQSQSMKAA